MSSFPGSSRSPVASLPLLSFSLCLSSSSCLPRRGEEPARCVTTLIESKWHFACLTFWTLVCTAERDSNARVWGAYTACVLFVFLSLIA